MGVAADRNCSLHALLAARSRRAVVYRRGPSKLTCLIAWDRADDSFEVGQWFRGSVYPDRSDLSPDGTHLLTFLGKFRGPFGTFTTLSRPPHYTALALWPKGDTWGGGGRFLSDTMLVLDHSPSEHALAPGFALPEGFTLVPPGPGRDDLIRRALARDPHAWHPHEGLGGTYVTRTWTRRSDQGDDLRARWYAENVTRPWTGERRVDLMGRDRSFCLDGVRWADFDAGGDLLFALGGRLHRCPAHALRGPASFAELVGSSRVLADFTDLVFRAVLAPYRASVSEPGGEDAGPEAFHPALDRVTREERRARKRGRMLARRGAARPA